MNTGISKAARSCSDEMAVTEKLFHDLCDYLEALADDNEEAAFIAAEDFKASAGIPGTAINTRLIPDRMETLEPEERFVVTAAQCLTDRIAVLRKKFMDTVLYQMIEERKAEQEAAKEADI